MKPLARPHAPEEGQCRGGGLSWPGLECGPRRWLPTLALGVILSIWLLLWRLFGVQWVESASFLLYEALYSVVPGVGLYRILVRPPGTWLRQIAVGWPLGAALSLSTFMLLAALGQRGLYPFYPVFLLPVFGLFHARILGSSPREAAERLPRRLLWQLIGLVLAVTLAIALPYFRQTPLPRDTESLAYYVDVTWDVGNIEELMHHWPPQDPRLAGEPFEYHFFAFAYMAATASTTGIDSSVVMFRLYILPLALLLVLQLYLLGKEVTGRHGVGLITVVVVVLLGETAWAPTSKFLNDFLIDLYYSPTFFFGLVFFVPLVLEVSSWALDGRGRWSTLIPIALLTFACAGTKPSIVPIVFCGLVGLAAWNVVSGKRPGVRVSVACLAVLGVFASVFLWLYSRGSMTFWLGPLDAVRAAPGFIEYLPRLKEFVGGFLHLGGGFVVAASWVLVYLVGFYGVRLVGVGYLLCSEPFFAGPKLMWQFMMFLAAAVPSYLLRAPGVSELYFLFYGLVPLGVLASLGLSSLHRRRSISWLHRAVWVGVGALILLSLANTARQQTEAALTTSHGWPRTSGALYEGLQWIRRNSPSDAVLVIDVPDDPRQFAYSAFAGRRILLEGWAYTAESQKTSGGGRDPNTPPYPERLAIVDDIYHSADPTPALVAAYGKYGARYILVDPHGSPSGLRSSPIAVLVFANSALEVYRLQPAP